MQIYKKWFLVLLEKSAAKQKTAWEALEGDGRIGTVSTMEDLEKWLYSFPKDTFIAAVSPG